MQGTVPEEIQQKLKEIEYELRYEELAVLRKLAMDRVKKQRDLAEVNILSLSLSLFLTHMNTHTTLLTPLHCLFYPGCKENNTS